LAYLAILTEQVNEILAFGIKREVANVNGHSKRGPGTDSFGAGVPGKSVNGADQKGKDHANLICVNLLKGRGRLNVPKEACTHWNLNNSTTPPCALIEECEGRRKENGRPGPTRQTGPIVSKR
jgi:hypothetical protein